MDERGRAARIPALWTLFFGREEEKAWLKSELAAPHVRLVTVTGPGGAGKTRLALEVAHELARDTDVCFAALADVDDPRMIPVAVADALGVHAHGAEEVGPRLVAALRGRPLLLVLDNVEQLLHDDGDGAGGACRIRRWLEQAPELTCLVTSRRRLGLAAEREYPLPPLPTPGACDPAERLLEFPSVQLFLNLAQAVRPSFDLRFDNAAVIRELGERLENMPLAIELAAARVNVLSVAKIVEQLRHSLDVLVSRQADTEERHRSQTATVELSCRLLCPRHQRLFTRLSVFRGGWTLDAPAAICADDAPSAAGPPGIGSAGMPKSHSHLQECSLILAVEDGGVTRYRMLEQLRQFAETRLDPADRLTVGRRHLDYYLAFARA